MDRRKFITGTLAGSAGLLPGLTWAQGSQNNCPRALAKRFCRCNRAISRYTPET